MYIILFYIYVLRHFLKSKPQFRSNSWILLSFRATESFWFLKRHKIEALSHDVCLLFETTKTPYTCKCIDERTSTHTHTHTHERASGGLCNYRKSKIEGRKRAEDRLLAFAFHDALPATLYNAASREWHFRCCWDWELLRFRAIIVEEGQRKRKKEKEREKAARMNLAEIEE